MVSNMAYVNASEGTIRDYSHCPLKKRPLPYVTIEITDDDQPQDLSIKKRRCDSDQKIGTPSLPPPPPKPTVQPPTSGQFSSVPTHPGQDYRSQSVQIPVPCSSSRLPSLADFYLKLFENSSAAPPVQQPSHPPIPSGMFWRGSSTWPVMHSASPHPPPTASHNHVLSTTHPLLAARLASPQPSEDRLASPGSTASEDSGVGTEETLSEDEIDIIGDSESPTRRASLEVNRGAFSAVPQAEARYSCTPCRKSYSTYAGLIKHKQFHCASLGNKSFACKHCDKVYTSLGALKMHIRTHTLPCKCPLCGKAFSRPWLLQGHIRTHTGEKPFQCPQCDRCFADRSNLRAHLQTHADIKKYACNTCHKTFSRMSLLNKHTEAACPARLSQQNAVPKQKEEQDTLEPAS